MPRGNSGVVTRADEVGMMTRALLLLARWFAEAHDRWRSRLIRRRPLSVEVDLLQGRIQRLQTENELLRGRLLRLDPHRRPRYRPWERLDILYHCARHRLSVKATAAAFVVSMQTILNWIEEVKQGTKKLVNAREPINRLPALVDHIVHRLKFDWPRFGTRRIAGILARLALKGSRTSVQRILRRRPRRPVKSAKKGRSLRAKRPGHVYVIDFTKITSMFTSAWVGAVIDAFSRKVLSIRVSRTDPPAAFACALLADAIRSSGKPAWVVSDKGTQFTSGRFKRMLRRRRIRRRYARVGNPILSRIDRFWRSMKEEYVTGLLPYLPVRSMERRLRTYATWFNSHRPHEGLKLRTPHEVHAGRRRRKARITLAGKLTIERFGGDRRLPVFRFRRAS